MNFSLLKLTWVRFLGRESVKERNHWRDFDLLRILEKSLRSS